MAITKKPRPPKKSKKRVFWLVLLAIVAVLGLVGYRMAQSLLGPAYGTVVTTVPLAQQAPPPVELEQFDGKHLSFARPITYEQRPPRPDEAKSLESHTFISSGMISKVLLVTVNTLPSGRLEDDASYHMRTLNPDRYKIREIKVKEEKVMIATNTAEHQQTAFWPHGGKLLTFTLTGLSTDSATVNEEYEKMLQSVTWK